MLYLTPAWVLGVFNLTWYIMFFPLGVHVSPPVRVIPFVYDMIQEMTSETGTLGWDLRKCTRICFLSNPWFSWINLYQSAERSPYHWLLKWLSCVALLQLKSRNFCAVTQEARGFTKRNMFGSSGFFSKRPWKFPKSCANIRARAVEIWRSSLKVVSTHFFQHMRNLFRKFFAKKIGFLHNKNTMNVANLQKTLR